MQLMLGRCPKCNHEVGTLRGQFYCVRCRTFPLDPGKPTLGNYQRAEFPDSPFWTAERIYTLLHLHNRTEDT